MHRLLKAKQCKEGRRKETEKNWRKGFDGNEILFFFITIILLLFFAPIYITITTSESGTNITNPNLITPDPDTCTQT